MVVGSSLIISFTKYKSKYLVKMMAITGFSISFIIGILLVIKFLEANIKIISKFIIVKIYIKV